MSERLKNVAFSLTCPQERAWLVVTGGRIGPRVIEMRQECPGILSACADLVPGQYHCRYYSGDERNVMYYGPAHTEGSIDCGMDALVSVNVPEKSEVPQFVQEAGSPG